MMFVIIVDLFLFIMTLVACLIFIHFMIKNYEDISQRLSNLLYLEMAVFNIFYVTILVTVIFVHSQEEEVMDKAWVLVGVLQTRMMFAILNLLLLLEFSIITILKQHFMNTYLLLSTHFMWSPYLVIKTILLVILQSMVNIAAEDDEITKIKITNAGKLLKNYIGIPGHLVVFLCQLIILLPWLWKKVRKLLKWLRSLFPQATVSNQVIELAVISQDQNNNNNWVQEPIEPIQAVEDSELFPTLIETGTVVINLVNIILATTLGINETIEIRNTLAIVTVTISLYVWILSNNRLRSHIETIVSNLIWCVM